MVIVLFDFLVNLVAVGIKVHFSLNSVIELFEFPADCFLILFWSIVCNKLLCREKSQVVNKELSCRKGILSVCHYRKLLVDYAVFKKEVCITFNDVVEVLFVFSNHSFNFFSRNFCKLPYCTQELTCLCCADWKNRIMQIRCSEFLFQLLNVFQANPWRNQKIEFCLWHKIDIFDSAVIAEDCIRSKPQLAHKIFKLAQVS